MIVHSTHTQWLAPSQTNSIPDIFLFTCMFAYLYLRSYIGCSWVMRISPGDTFSMLTLCKVWQVPQQPARQVTRSLADIWLESDCNLYSRIAMPTIFVEPMQTRTSVNSIMGSTLWVRCCKMSCFSIELSILTLLGWDGFEKLPETWLLHSSAEMDERLESADWVKTFEYVWVLLIDTTIKFYHLR